MTTTRLEGKIDKFHKTQVTGVTSDVIFDQKYNTGEYKYIIFHFYVKIWSKLTARPLNESHTFKEAGLRSKGNIQKLPDTISHTEFMKNKTTRCNTSDNVERMFLQ